MKKIYSYVVSIVKSDYNQDLPISHSSANDVLEIYSSAMRFYKKKRYIFFLNENFFSLAIYV